MFRKFLFTTTFLAFSNAFAVDNLKSVFGSNICIPGSLNSIDLEIKNNLGLKETENGFISTLVNTSSLESKTVDDKSVLSRLNELVQHNGINYVYKLEKEEGPPHDRTFTVSLKLGDQVFMGEGKSLKKAQRNAAAFALEETKYEGPPTKELKDNILTPTVLLNNLCMKLGLPVKYSQVDAEKQSGSRSKMDGKQKKSYLQKLNESIYSDSVRIKKDVAQTKGPFRISVEVGEHIFYGISHTIQTAKHQAASNAIDFLVQNKDKVQSDCLQDEDSQHCQKARQTLKSPVSLVYEAAQARKLDIAFEIIEEIGPAHRKTFITECRLGGLMTVGEGKSKKDSKKAAAESMLERVPELAPISQEMQVMSMMKDKKKKKKKKNKIIKTKFQEMGVAIENFVDSVWNLGQEDANSAQGSDDAPTGKKPANLKKSPQDQMLELSNFLNIEVQYTDFQENDEHFSILSVFIDPEHICLGSGLNGDKARNVAANGAIDLLHHMGLYDHFEHDELSLERETKVAVGAILSQEAAEDS